MKKILAIDPDVTKPGMALFDRGVFTIHTLPLSILYNTLAKFEGEIRIEAGWLNKSNWHVKEGMNASVASEIGMRTGQNHGVGIALASYCQSLSKDVKLVRPSIKKPTRKKMLEMFKVKPNNQEELAALLLLRDKITTQ